MALTVDPTGSDIYAIRFTDKFARNFSVPNGQDHTGSYHRAGVLLFSKLIDISTPPGRLQRRIGPRPFLRCYAGNRLISQVDLEGLPTDGFILTLLSAPVSVSFFSSAFNLAAFL